jgi:hypothetical protein
MTTDEIKLEMEGLDKRTKRYKDLEKKLYSSMSFEESQEDNFIDYYEEKAIEITEENFRIKESAYKVSDEIYNTFKGFKGRVPSNKVKWLFKTYNQIFNQRLTQCLCPGKIKKMVIKTIKTYEKERR